MTFSKIVECFLIAENRKIQFISNFITELFSMLKFMMLLSHFLVFINCKVLMLTGFLVKRNRWKFSSYLKSKIISLPYTFSLCLKKYKEIYKIFNLFSSLEYVILKKTSEMNLKNNHYLCRKQNSEPDETNPMSLARKL